MIPLLVLLIVAAEYGFSASPDASGQPCANGRKRQDKLEQWDTLLREHREGATRMTRARILTVLP